MSENEPKIDSKPLEQADQYQGEKRSRPEDRILLTDDEMIEKIYDEFKEIIKETHNTNDLTAFLFIDTDTNTEIEDE